MMQSSMVTNNSMMRDSAGASPVPDKERNPSMRSKALGGLLAAALSLSPAVAIGVQTAYAAGGDTAATEYTLYPKPHSIRYDSGQYILRDINVIYDDDIDEATQDRLDEVAALKNLNVTESDAAVSGKTNVYVGVNGSDGKAETAIESKYSPDSAIFDKTDSYFLKSDNGTISVLGKDTDASFYGLTTLYQVLGQIDSLTIRNFTVTDYADVVSRGFIEGYYGNPWSTQDRINLMKWGGYYKLNSYFYAPKDDPKHNSQWRTLYTQDELDTKIKPLADAGNASKTRFVFALHPFMNNAIRFNSEANYQADLKVLQDKFAQTIGVGVRQIAILADDAANVGGNNYTKLLTDMVAWLKEMKKTYPDLKTTLPFVTQEYMGNGMSYFANFPKEVQIVMTGGRVWGEVSQNFTDTFTSNVGRGPYMWINWPCSDNSKSHLIMGGYDTFLHPGVDPSKIQGIVLNPMQQSEPSKQGIFMAADYSWNLWQSEKDGQQSWEDSFSYIDHNSPIASKGSRGLRDLAMNMRILNDGGIDGAHKDAEYDAINKWWINNESVDYTGKLDVKGVLTELKGKLDGIAVGAEVNQNAFSNILVGSTTIAADTKTDTLTFVAGTNVTLTPDAANDKLTIAAKDTTYAAATQSVAGLMSAADKKSVDYCEALRLSMIGVPRYWRSTTLPANHVWANGDLVLFSDWPELKKVYDGGGFTGMLLAYNAISATIAANLGKWRPNAANPTGLYVPKLSDQFFRAWTGTGESGRYNAPGLPELLGGFSAYTFDAGMPWQAITSVDSGMNALTVGSSGGTRYNAFTFRASLSNTIYGASSTVMPPSVNLPVILYLGIPA